MKIMANALSRYTSAEPNSSDVTRVNEMEHYVDLIVSPNGSDFRLKQLKVDQMTQLDDR